MPSGMTAAIYDGTDTSLRGYLMTVGRGMGFAVMQRDDDPSAPVRRITPSTGYHDREIQVARIRLRELEAMTPEQALEACRADFDTRDAAWLRRRDEKLALRRRYETMIAQVEAWEPEPLIAEMQTKQEALRHLRESLDFDCGQPGEEMCYDPRPVALPVDEWLRREIGQTRATIERAEQSIEEEVERTDERNRYIEAFLASLPPEGDDDGDR